MFSKFSQFTQSLQDELATGKPQKQIADPQIAKGILKTETPPVDEITTPEDVDKERDITQPNNDKIQGTQIPLSLLESVDPEEVKALRLKLAKFQKYDALYPKLHEAYKVEKKKSALIGAFESMLHELTPIESIGDLEAMRDYLSGLNKKATLMNSELTNLQKEKTTLSEKVKDLELKVKDKGQIEWRLREADVKLRQFDALKKRVTELESEQKEASPVASHEELIKAKDTINNLQEQLKTLEKENNGLADKAKTFDEEKNHLQHELKTANDEMGHIQSQVTTKQAQFDERVHHLEEELKSKNDTNEREVKDLKSQIDESQKSLESNTKLLNKFKDKVQTLTKEIEDLESKQNKSNSNGNSTGQGKKNKNKKSNGKPSAIKETEKDDISVSTATADVLSSSSSGTEVIELKHSLEELQCKLEESQREIGSLNKSIKEKNEEIENLKDMLRDVGDSLVQAKDSSKDINDQLKDLHSQLQAKAQELQSAKNDLEMVRVQNANALKDYEKTKNSINKKLADNMKLVEDLQGKLQAEKDTINSVQKERDQLSSKLAKSQESEKLLSQKVTSLQKDYDSQKVELESLKKSKKNDSNLSLELSNVKSQLSSKLKVLTEAESRIKFLQEEKTKLNDSLIELKVQSKQIASKEKTFEEFKSNLTNLNAKLKTDLTENNIQLNKLILEKNQLIKQVEELQDKYAEAKDVKFSSNETVDSLKKKLDELNMRNKEYENRIEIISEELIQARSMLQDRTRESSTMRKILMDNEQSQNNEMKELKVKFEKLLEEKAQIEDEALVNMRSKLKEIDELKKAQKDLSIEVENLTNEKDGLLSKLNTKSSLSAHNISHSTPVPIANDDKEANQYNNKLVESLRTTLETTEKKLRELDDMNSKLRKVNQESSDKLIWLSKKYKVLSQQYKRRVSETDMRSRNGSIVSQESGGDGPNLGDGNVNTVSDGYDGKEKATYIKNVLLGFLEHREQRQMLLPVIKTLLYMSDDDEKKLTTLLA